MEMQFHINTGKFVHLRDFGKSDVSKCALSYYVEVIVALKIIWIFFRLLISSM